MASEDVIELGSSDDEAEPAPKKVARSRIGTQAQSKPVPNAMVHIPKSTPGLSLQVKKVPIIKGNKIKTLKQCQTPPNVKHVNLVKMPGSTTISKIPIKGNFVQNNPTFNKVSLNKPILNKAIQKLQINPMNMIKKISNSQLQVKKISNKGQSYLNSLPPGITVTKTNAQAQRKRVANPELLPNIVKKKQKVTQIPHTVTTVDLDDDEDDILEPSNKHPQWYIRPENQTPKKSDSGRNEKRIAEDKQLLEIFIEDSPIKSALENKMFEVGIELPIIVDDSPVKIFTGNNEDNCSSEDNKSVKQSPPQSKKRLQYPDNKDSDENTDESTHNVNPTVQLDNIDDKEECAVETTSPLCEENKESETVSENVKDNAVVHNKNEDTEKQKENKVPNVLLRRIKPVTVVIEYSPIKKDSSPQGTEQKSSEAEAVGSNSFNFPTENEIIDSEFHAIYQSFIDLCFKLEDSDDMKKIVENKIKAYYRQVPKEYTESEEFIEIVSSKMNAMRAAPDKMYLYIKDIVDELKLQRKMAKSQMEANVKTGNDENDAVILSDDISYDSKQRRQIRKLEKTLKKLHRVIQKLEEEEVDFDDEADSVYLLTESDESNCSTKDNDNPPEKNRNALKKRYKDRLIRVHSKLCQITKTKMPSEPRVHIEPRQGHPSGPARRLEKWVNKKAPVGTSLPFPDFHDVLRCVREANVEDKLNWNEADIMEEARDLFTRCGKKLQRRRQENEWRVASSRITSVIDPAEENEDLKKDLEENRKLATRKESDVINKFADKQKHLNLEAEEIGENEAEESPLESDDEAQEEQDDNNDCSKSKHFTDKERKTVPCEQETKDIESGNTKLHDKENKKESEILYDIEEKVCNENTTNKHEAITSLESNVLESDNINCISENRMITESIDTEAEVISMTAGNADLNLNDNLLEKWYSESDHSTSNLESCDTLIALSDTSESTIVKKPIVTSSSVFSIQSSSNSDTDLFKPKGKKIENTLQHAGKLLLSQESARNVKESIFIADYSTDNRKATRNSNEEYLEPMADILLATTDEDSNEEITEPGNTKKLLDTNDRLDNSNEFVNLKDDAFSCEDMLILNKAVFETSNTTTSKDSTEEIVSIIDSPKFCEDVVNNVVEGDLNSCTLKDNFDSNTLVRECDEKHNTLSVENDNDTNYNMDVDSPKSNDLEQDNNNLNTCLERDVDDEVISTKSTYTIPTEEDSDPSGDNKYNCKANDTIIQATDIPYGNKQKPENANLQNMKNDLSLQCKAKTINNTKCDNLLECLQDNSSSSWGPKETDEDIMSIKSSYTIPTEEDSDTYTGKKEESEEDKCLLAAQGSISQDDETVTELNKDNVNKSDVISKRLTNNMDTLKGVNAIIEEHNDNIPNNCRETDDDDVMSTKSAYTIPTEEDSDTSTHKTQTPILNENSLISSSSLSQDDDCVIELPEESPNEINIDVSGNTKECQNVN